MAKSAYGQAKGRESNPAPQQSRYKALADLKSEPGEARWEDVDRDVLVEAICKVLFGGDACIISTGRNHDYLAFTILADSEKIKLSAGTADAMEKKLCLLIGV